MVSELLGKLIVKFSNISMKENSNHKLTIDQGTAAAFDLAFRLTPIPVTRTLPFFGTEYEENAVNRVLDMINRVII